MGAWGVGPLENDAALDVVQTWKRFRVAGHSPEVYTPEGTIDWFLGNNDGGGIGTTMDWGDVDTVCRLIALAELFHRDGLAIRGKVKEYFEEAISWELRKDALEEWDDAKSRKRALEELLSRIGGKRQRLTKSKLFHHATVEFSDQAELFQKPQRWLRGIRAHKLSEFPSDQEYPRLWQVLDRVMNSRIRHLDDALRVEARAQRLMLLAAYVAIYLQLPDVEAMNLVRRAKGRSPIFGNATDLYKEYLTSPEHRTGRASEVNSSDR